MSHKRRWNIVTMVMKGSDQSKLHLLTWEQSDFKIWPVILKTWKLLQMKRILKDWHVYYTLSHRLLCQTNVNKEQFYGKYTVMSKVCLSLNFTFKNSLLTRLLFSRFISGRNLICTLMERYIENTSTSLIFS